MKLLLATNDVDFVEMAVGPLREVGFEVVTATDGQQALRQWKAESPGLILLDANLPTPDGFEVCRRIRRTAGIPIVMLIPAAAEEEQGQRALRVGADDYVRTPCSARHLVARLRPSWSIRHPPAPPRPDRTPAGRGSAWRRWKAAT